jgi:amylovoran biosynthesis glycosyltransferase AmsE
MTTSSNTSLEKWISILIPSYNTDNSHISECINSIYQQTANYGFEIVWIDDGSTIQHSDYIQQSLQQLSTLRPNCKIVYKKMDTNSGIVACLNLGLDLCTYDLIFRMDSDDIMTPDRISKQCKFMEDNEDCMICGANLFPFCEKMESGKLIKKQADAIHKHMELLTWEEFVEKKYTWIMNHPTLCYRRTAVIEVGKYDSDKYQYSAMEDFELELRFLKKYGKIYNLSDILLLYRVHSNQITQKTRHVDKSNMKKDIVNNIIYNYI